MKRFWVLALATCLVIGCAPPSVYRKIERTAVNAIQTELGPADSWSAKVSRDSIGELVEGDISRLSIKGKKVRPRPDIIIDEVILEARDLHEALRVFREDGFDYLADVSSAHYPERNEIELIETVTRLAEDVIVTNQEYKGDFE